MPSDSRTKWLIGGGLGVAAYVAYRYIQNRNASASTASTAGGTIPAEGTVTSTSPTPTTFAAWQDAALTFGSSPVDMLNAITNWMAGNCVDQSGYNGLQQAITQLGLPPGFNQFQVLTVCSAGVASGSGSGSGAGGSGSSGGSGGGGAAAGGGSSAPTPSIAIPRSPSGAAAPTVGGSGEALPGGALPAGAISLPAPITNDEAGVLASAAGLQPGQTGVTPNGLKLTKTVVNGVTITEIT